MVRTALISALALVIGHVPLHAQVVTGRDLVIQEITIPGMPGLQSFAWGQYGGQWFLIGGRTDGLHRRQPPVAFLAADNNVSAYVVDPVTMQVWSASIASLPQSMQEQLQSTNMQFEQRDTVLYCVGGYGYSATAADHITFPDLTAIDLPGVMYAIRNAQPITAFFRQITDPRLEVTGGQLRLVNGKFYLVGGQRFIGRYNPMGPGFGPGFIQEYTNAIRRFAIDDDGIALGISDYWEMVDTVNLHRRDYNMLPQIFPDGSEGLTVFSGVFQYTMDLPWLNTVDIVDTNYTVVPGFEQRLNQYHTAHAALYDSAQNVMRSLFFGGMAQYHFDSTGTLIDDPNVPFVRTISMVRRDGSGQLFETQEGLMPALLGSSAELIPWPGTPQTAGGILRADLFTGDTVVVGHIVGGIESTAANIFFINTGAQSDATTRVFRVLLVDPVSTVIEGGGAPSIAASFRIDGDLLLTTFLESVDGPVTIGVLDATGREVRTKGSPGPGSEGRTLEVDLNGLTGGAYTVELRSGTTKTTWRFIR